MFFLCAVLFPRGVLDEIFNLSQLLRIVLPTFPFLDGDVPGSTDILWCLYFSTDSFCSSVQSC